MNRSRRLRFVIFIITVIIALVYPFYVRQYLLGGLAYVGLTGPLADAFQAQLALNTGVIFCALMVILFPASVLVIYLFGRVSVGERLFFRRNQVQSGSTKNFQLEKWYDLTRRYLGNTWFVHLYEGLEQSMLIPNPQKVTFVSPAANRGVYEKTLFEALRDQGVEVRGIIADIDILEKTAVPQGYDPGLTYVAGREALEIKAYLKAQDLETTDLIFDIKGSLWYAFRSDGSKTALFERFYDVLSPSGLIVVDHSKKRFSAFCIYYLFGIVSWYVETSTGDLLKRQMKRDKAFKAFIEARFDLKPQTFVNEFGDRFEVMVLKKK